MESTSTAPLESPHSLAAARCIASPATVALLDGDAIRDLGVHRLKDFDAGTRPVPDWRRRLPATANAGQRRPPDPATRSSVANTNCLRPSQLCMTRPASADHPRPGRNRQDSLRDRALRLLAGEAEGGTVFVPLAALRDPELVMPAIAERLGAGSARRNRYRRRSRRPTYPRHRRQR